VAVRDGHHVAPCAENLAVQITFDEAAPSTRIDGVAVDIEFHDVVGGDHLRRERARHQKPLGMARMPHRNMAGRIEHALIGEDAARRGEVLQYGAIDRASRCAHGCSALKNGSTSKA
jgi:hypothetical protein